jgi:glycosyltransferase involved in cell wall biosynthesis
MRVLIVHNRYQQAGGEDMAVANEQALLARHGWQTRLWSVSNDRIAGPWGRITTAIRVPYSHPACRQLAGAIAEFGPTIVHVHNFFPLLSPSIYDACQAAGVAVVQTLHNYRAICPGALLSRAGHPCELCITGSPYQGAFHGCYRGSRLGSLAVARMVDMHRRRGTWLHKVDRFIALSEFAKSKFIAAGFPGDRISVKPNFAEDRQAAEATARDGALYVGRLSAEKGIATLLRAWQTLEVPLRIVGDGPARKLVENAGIPTVRALGRRSAAEIAREMAQAAFLILPSQVYENFPMVIAEAFCQGLPVIASRIGALAELVEGGATGLLFSPGEAADLADKVRWTRQHSEAVRAMGRNARRVYEEKYSPSVNFRQLTGIYAAAVARNRSRACGEL